MDVKATMQLLSRQNYPDIWILCRTLSKIILDRVTLKVGTWIRNPFQADLESISDEDLPKDDFIDLWTKKMLRNVTRRVLHWCALLQAYPYLVKWAMSPLIPFITTYLCESGFSVLVLSKRKVEIDWMSKITCMSPC